MADNFHEIDIHDLPPLLGGGPTDNLTDDFVLGRFKYKDDLKFMEHPCRINGYCAFYCVKGDFKIELNLKTFDVTDNTLVIYMPGNILRLKQYTHDMVKDADILIVATSKELVHDLQLDMKNLYEESMNLLNNPCIQVNEEQHMVLRQYYRLVTSLMELDLPKRKDAIRSLGSSLFYFFVAMWSKNIDNVKVESAGRNSARANIVMENFLKLVGEHHHEERQVGFYAEKLYLTPKYLSKLVRSVSGRSAPEWINSFVILEAKNLLKYSNLSIKEIVYKLHFSSVPSFYKFFRKQTGMTPMEYRES